MTARSMQFLSVALILLCESVTAAEAPSPALPSNLPGLPRVFKISSDIYTGYEPIAASGFGSLKSLGIKVIVSTDGAKPDIEKAKAHGMQYVHIPYGYDAIPAGAQKSIFKVMKELKGPFYFHCHHGQHRGPAAAAIALRIKSGCDGPTAQKVLETCGTGKDYRGLWKSVLEFQPPKPGEPLPELRETAKVEDFTEAMAGIDRTFDNLNLAQKAGWKTPADHPDLAPEHEALILGESLRTATRLNVDKFKQEDFWLRMREAEKLALDLKDAIKRGTEADQRFELVEKNCTACHKLYRNNKEKTAGK